MDHKSFRKQNLLPLGIAKPHIWVNFISLMLTDVVDFSWKILADSNPFLWFVKFIFREGFHFFKTFAIKGGGFKKTTLFLEPFSKNELYKP